MAMDRRSTVRMNKERLKAALDNGFDEASVLRWVRSRNVYRPRTGGIDAIEG